MNWGAIGLADVAALSAAAALLATWLYLRQPRAARRRVSTLRFWESAPSGSSSARRRELREPLALLAQILFLVLVIAALGNPRWGAATQGRDVAIVLDAGAWSQMHPAGRASWVEQVRAQANALLASLPGNDRILLLRADLDGEPVLPFTTDRAALRSAIANLEASSSVADIPRALEEGRDAVSGSASGKQRRGLLAYIGPGFMDQEQARALDEFRESLMAATEANATASPKAAQAGAPPEFLVRLAGGTAAPANIGITQIALKRSLGAPDEWAVMTRVKNYNDVPARVMLRLSMGGNAFWADELSIAPRATENASDDFTSRSGGLLEAQITPGDDLPGDNRATIVLPSSMPVSVAVVTSRASFAAKMRAVLAANPYVKADFVRAGVTPPPAEDVVIYDGAVPAGTTEPAVISFLSAAAGEGSHRVRLANWNSGHPVTRWIQSRDVTVRATQRMEPGAADVVLASSSGTMAEPLIVAREANGRRSVIVDFDPVDSNFTEEPAFPLLMAGAIEWMTHPIAERGEFLTAGPMELGLPLSRIAAPSGRDVLFAADGGSVHFFAAESGVYQVTNAGRALDVPINTPPLPTMRMAPTAAEAASLETQPIPLEQRELWRWLAALGLIALWLEWRFFYLRRERMKEGVERDRFAATGVSIGLREREQEGEHAVRAEKS